MRDPGLVQRAERAAIALERAWGQWRSQHGLGAQPPTPVSSYVGYSLDEPWGQPRVVFGVGADEAEMLAALLDGHDCVGPVHAEVTDWRRAGGTQLAIPPIPADNRLAVPVQAPSPVEPAPSPAESAEHEPVDDEPVAHEPAGRESAGHEALLLEAVPLEELAPLPPNEAGSGAFDTPSPGPGYCGPRYQGFPPHYQPEGAVRSDADATVSDDDDEAESAGDQPDRALPLLISKLGRSHRSQRGAHEAGSWAQEQEREQTADTAV